MISRCEYNNRRILPGDVLASKDKELYSLSFIYRTDPVLVLVSSLIVDRVETSMMMIINPHYVSTM